MRSANDDQLAYGGTVNGLLSVWAKQSVTTPRPITSPISDRFIPAWRYASSVGPICHGLDNGVNLAEILGYAKADPEGSVGARGEVSGGDTSPHRGGI